MKFSNIIEHLKKRGFSSREQWNDKSYMFFGMGDIAWIVKMDFDESRESMSVQKSFWNPCLDDINAEDWISKELYWNTSKDDFLPWELGS